MLEPAVNHHADSHLQDGSHAFVGPFFAAADWNEENVAVLKPGIGNLVRQNFLQRQISFGSACRRIANQLGVVLAVLFMPWASASACSTVMVSLLSTM